jgi:hypothetical protein
MKRLLIANQLIIIGAIAGALGGFLYWKFIGCNSGTCIISSKPLNSTIYFSVVGAVMFSAFKKNNKTTGSK